MPTASLAPLDGQDAGTGGGQMLVMEPLKLVRFRLVNVQPSPHRVQLQAVEHGEPVEISLMTFFVVQDG